MHTHFLNQTVPIPLARKKLPKFYLRLFPSDLSYRPDWLTGIHGSLVAAPKITVGAIQSILKNSNNRKTPRPDRINNNVLKLLHKQYPTVLSRLITACLTHHHFLSPWKEARLVFIRKIGKDHPSTTEGYRPISLLSMVGKLFEKILAQHITTFLESQQFISKNQFGFHSGTSTEEAAHKAISTIKATNSCDFPRY